MALASIGSTFGIQKRTQVNNKGKAKHITNISAVLRVPSSSRQLVCLLEVLAHCRWRTISLTVLVSLAVDGTVELYLINVNTISFHTVISQRRALFSLSRSSLLIFG